MVVRITRYSIAIGAGAGLQEQIIFAVDEIVNRENSLAHQLSQGNPILHSIYSITALIVVPSLLVWTGYGFGIIGERIFRKYKKS